MVMEVDEKRDARAELTCGKVKPLIIHILSYS
jgi:hypothetical protein